MIKIFIKRKSRRKEDFQFFMHDFVDACELARFNSKKDLMPSYKWHIRAFFKHLLLFFYRVVHQYLPFLISRKKALIIAANGMTINDIAFPYYGSYEIVPMLWDVWPSTWERMYDSFRLLDVKTVLVTSKQVASMINRETDIHAYWIPEGINSTLYHKGDVLEKRTNDVFEMGRQMPAYHEMLVELNEKSVIHGLTTSNINANGTLNDKKVAFSNEELYELMSQSKVMVCFPQCDTNPARAGDIETLTLRYWEAMLSRCVMVGRSPAELIDFIGYDPVINVDWDHPQQQLIDLLNHIGDYQELVDKNLKVALEMGSWEKRMPLIKKYLNEQGYEI
jgi:hypothetical protein